MYLQAVLSSLLLRVSLSQLKLQIQISGALKQGFQIQMPISHLVGKQSCPGLAVPAALSVRWLSCRQELERPLNAEDAEPDWSLSCSSRIILASPVPKLLSYPSHKFLLKHTFTLHAVLVNSSFLISSLLYLNTLQ